MKTWIKTNPILSAVVIIFFIWLIWYFLFNKSTRIFAYGGIASSAGSRVAKKSQNWHGASNSQTSSIGNKVLTIIGYQPSIFSAGETVNVEFRLSSNTPVVQTIKTKVVKILNPPPLPASLIEIDSPFELKYENAYGRIYN